MHFPYFLKSEEKYQTSFKTSCQTHSKLSTSDVKTRIRKMSRNFFLSKMYIINILMYVSSITLKSEGRRQNSLSKTCLRKIFRNELIAIFFQVKCTLSTHY